MKILILLTFNVAAGFLDAYAFSAPVFSFLLIIFNFLLVRLKLNYLRLHKRFLIWIAASFIPFFVCIAVVNSLERKMLSNVNTLVDSIDKFYKKNNYFPEDLSQISSDYSGVRRNKISYSGYYVITYKYVKNSLNRWPIIEVRNKNYYYLIDSQNGRTLGSPKEVLD